MLMMILVVWTNITLYPYVSYVFIKLRYSPYHDINVALFQAPQDLACFTTLQDMSIYFCVNAKTDHKSPTEHAISFKVIMLQ